MSIEAIRRRVEERVQQEIIPVLLDRGVLLHKKKDWRNCDCGYCNAKRGWSAYIGISPHGLGYEQRVKWRQTMQDRCRQELNLEAKKV